MKLPEFKKQIMPSLYSKNNKQPHVWYLPQGTQWKLPKIYRRAYSQEYYIAVDTLDWCDSKAILLSSRRFWPSYRGGFYARKIIAGPFPSFRAACTAYRILPENFDGIK